MLIQLNVEGNWPGESLRQRTVASDPVGDLTDLLSKARPMQGLCCGLAVCVRIVYRVVTTR